jgi:hypothetical protein
VFLMIEQEQSKLDDVIDAELAEQPKKLRDGCFETIRMLAVYSSSTGLRYTGKLMQVSGVLSWYSHHPNLFVPLTSSGILVEALGDGLRQKIDTHYQDERIDWGNSEALIQHGISYLVEKSGFVTGVIGAAREFLEYHERGLPFMVAGFVIYGAGNFLRTNTYRTLTKRSNVHVL